jgi:hypothetical protein
MVGESVSVLTNHGSRFAHSGHKTVRIDRSPLDSANGVYGSAADVRALPIQPVSVAIGGSGSIAVRLEDDALQLVRRAVAVRGRHFRADIVAPTEIAAT